MASGSFPPKLAISRLGLPSTKSGCSDVRIPGRKMGPLLESCGFPFALKKIDLKKPLKGQLPLLMLALSEQRGAPENDGSAGA
jgi:hypothetical protein